MYFENFLSSNFNFNDEETLLKFKFKMFNSSMITIAIVTFFIGLLSQLGINDIGSTQTLVNYIHSLSTLFLLALLRFSKEYFEIISLGLILISLLNVTSALIFVTHDEFRMMWFFILVFLAYILNGSRMGLIFTFVSIIDIIVANALFDLHLSSLAINTAIFGLIGSSALMRAYTTKIQDYEESIKAKSKELAQLASIDHLTGIMNKRVFDDVTKRYFETAQRHNQYIHILTLDIDHFKSVNDTYGHQIGDLLLVRFVETIQTLLRKSDIFARVGGEEFIIVLYKTDLAGSMKVAEKIRQEVKAIRCKSDERFIKITTSIGVSRSKPEDNSVDALLKRSDKALYQAKREGRDRVCLVD